MTSIELTSEGFSFHTLGLKTHPDGTDFAAMVDALYRWTKGTDKQTYLIPNYCSKNKKVYFSNVLQKYGIRLYLTAASKDRYTNFTVKAIVNPRLVLNPDSGYLGIMPPDSDSLEHFQDEFAVLMWRYGLPGYLDEWTLVRDDLCVNLQYNKKKAAREQSRMIHKDLLPSKMERVCFFDPKSSPEEQKEQKEKDRYILKLENGSYGLSVYDKLYQMEKEGLEMGSRLIKLPKGILRVELQCKKPYLDKLSKTADLETTSEQVHYLMENSRPLILKHMKKAFTCGTHYKPDAAISVIKASGYQKTTRDQLVWMVQRMRYPFHLKQLEKGMKKKFNATPRTVAQRLVQLQELRINPVPLRKDYYLDQQPSLPDILELLEDDATIIRIQSNGNETD